jgi:hypothetical protein
MGKIYKLECDDGYYYYGSTKGSLETRFVFHKKDSKSKKSPVYKHINTIGWDKVRIVLIEEINEGIKIKEDEYIRNNINDPLCLNSNIVVSTEEDVKKWGKTYRETHKEQEKERIAKWQQENPEKMIERQRRYIEKDPEGYKAKQKAWYEKNKESVLEKQRLYREANRDKAKAYAKSYYRNIIKSKSLEENHVDKTLS